MADIEDRSYPVNYENLKLIPGNIDSLEIAAWTPERDGKGTPTQVHLLINLERPMDDIGIVLRFKGPDTLGVLIEQLQRYKREAFG